MVYLREIIKKEKENLLQYNNLEVIAYWYLRDANKIDDFTFELSPEEKIALKGFKNEKIPENVISKIISKPAQKGIDVNANVYKLIGFYLGNKKALENKLRQKFKKTTWVQKYFISKFAPLFEEELKNVLLKSEDNSPEVTLINRILKTKDISDEELIEALEKIFQDSFDITKLVLLEDVEKVLLKINFNNLSPEEIIRNVLKNFNNAIQKIIKSRRKGHKEFEINDEYDVQDILYVILKSIFPNLKEEDPIPKLGGASSRIDLILREEEILIEVKMIKEKDKDEKEFIKQLKIDIESYHASPWLKKLFCFVYDPYNKTKDLNNFFELNGKRTKGKHCFDVEVVVIN